MSAGFSRRHFLGGLGITATASAGLIAGASEASAIGLEREKKEPPKPPLQDAVVAFDGVHQAGIETPVQSRLWLIAFDIKKDVDRTRLRNLMRMWTDDARRMASAQAPMTDLEPEMYAAPANLTITVGLGENFFTVADVRGRSRNGSRPFPHTRLTSFAPSGAAATSVCRSAPTIP